MASCTKPIQHRFSQIPTIISVKRIKMNDHSVHEKNLDTINQDIFEVFTTREVKIINNESSAIKTQLLTYGIFFID